MTRLVVILVAALAVCSNVQAGFVLSVQNGLTFAENSGVHTIGIFAHSPTSDAPTTLEASFSLSGGEFSPTAGVFGQPGMIGAGNILNEFSFFKGEDAPFQDVSSLQIEFASAQTFPTTPTLLAQFQIDTALFTPGSYTITPFLIKSAPVFTASELNSGSFTITAVPEPSSLLFVGAAAGGAYLWKRRRKPRRESECPAA